MSSAVTATPRSRPVRTLDRLTLYIRVILFSVVAAFAVAVVTIDPQETSSGALGGDFPAFYAAGSIVADGDWGSLYSPERQHIAQTELFRDADSFLYFAYPPHVAALYRPLAALDYRLAYGVHTMLMGAALAAALWLMRPVFPWLRRNMETAMAASLLFYPMFRAVTGGQNTALTVLLIAGVWRSLHDDRDAAAGLLLALLLYKPQFAVPLIGLVLLDRRWRTVGAAAVGSVGVWAAGAITMGAGWVSTWWAEVADFTALDADVNAHNAVSFLGFGEAVFGAESTIARAVAAPFIAVVIVALAAVWWGVGRWSLNDKMLAAVVGILLISPHAMFYDAGILALAGLALVARNVPRTAVVLAAAWLASWTQLQAHSVGVAPLFFVVVPLAAWAAWTLRAGYARNASDRALAAW